MRVSQMTMTELLKELERSISDVDDGSDANNDSDTFLPRVDRLTNAASEIHLRLSLLTKRRE
jgi:hypothetical protein